MSTRGFKMTNNMLYEYDCIIIPNPRITIEFHYSGIYLVSYLECIAHTNNTRCMLFPYLNCGPTFNLSFEWTSWNGASSIFDGDQIISRCCRGILELVSFWYLITCHLYLRGTINGDS